MKLIHKALDMIRKLAKEDPDEYNKDKTGNGLCWWATKKLAVGSESKSALKSLLSALMEVKKESDCIPLLETIEIKINGMEISMDKTILRSTTPNLTNRNPQTFTCSG